MTESSTRTYTVEGMSCEHCRASVNDHVAELEGVESVDVDLASGIVEVRGRGVSDRAVEAAGDEAGYQLSNAR